MTLHQSDGLNPPKGTLQQIASLLCKFVQAINSVSLGVPIWQQEWLESRTPATCHLGPGWEQHHNEARNYVLLLPPLCSCPLFPSILLLMPTSVPSVLFFGDVVTRCECWRQSQRASCLGWRTRNSFCLIFYWRAHLPSPSVWKLLIQEMKYA